MRVSRDRLIRLIKEELALALEQSGGVSSGEGEFPQPPPTNGLEGRERRHFGAWIEALPAVHKMIKRWPRYPSQWKNDIEDLGFEYVGQGSYRIVIRPIAAPDYVVKFVKGDWFDYMNKVESIYQGQFRGLFPRVFAHGAGAFGSDYDWIVIESVPKIIESGEDLVPFLPDLYYMVKTLHERGMINGSSYATIIEELDVLMAGIIAYVIDGRFPTILRNEGVPNDELTKELIDDVIDNTPFIRMAAMLAAKFNILPYELTRGNIGVSRDDKLIILDASIFDED